MTSPFATPGSPSGGLDLETLNGNLLLVMPQAVETGISTSFGLKDAVRADVVVLDGPEAGEEYNDTLIFPKVLQSQVRGNIGTGRRNLGRLGQGQAKKGQSPPWMLEDPSDADKASARAYLASSAAAPF